MTRRKGLMIIHKYGKRNWIIAVSNPRKLWRKEHEPNHLCMVRLHFTVVTAYHSSVALYIKVECLVHLNTMKVVRFSRVPLLSIVIKDSDFCCLLMLWFPSTASGEVTERREGAKKLHWNICYIHSHWTEFPM